MIPKECKRLAEVDFPIAEVGKYALAEKTRRMGTPHQLHLWWAWRPLAACRSVLLGLLLPDPCDPHCPEDFKSKARNLLPRLMGKVGPKDDDLRKALLRFIADFANWKVATHQVYLEVSRGLVKAAQGEEPPLVVDPFAGGGSIPLEALRLGCDAAGSDLNPVAATILNAKLNHIQRHGPSIGAALREAGAKLRHAVKADLADLYPVDSDGNEPIAYIWARTVRCDSPNCGAEIPLLRSFWLSKKRGRQRALRYEVVRNPGSVPEIKLHIFEPKNAREVPSPTVSQAKATCLACNTVMPADRVRAQLRNQRGGGDVQLDSESKRIGGARLVAVVYLKRGTTGRHYRLPTTVDYAGVAKAFQQLKVLEKETTSFEGLSPYPDEPLPPRGTLGFRVQLYGMSEWGDLFTARQKVAFATIARHVRSFAQSRRVPETLHALLAMVCSKLADRCNSIVNWSVGVECPNQIFKGNAIPMGWDFAESNLLSSSSASIEQTVDNIARNAEATYITGARPASPDLASATDSPLPDEAASIWFTDPPYYDSVPYADLSDFFYVWIKRALPPNAFSRDPFKPENPLTPKDQEAVQDESKKVDGRIKDRAFFEDTMAEAFKEGCRVLRPDTGIGCVVFAHKTTEGWEALLSGMIRGGWVITGSWPIATERAARVRARDSAALETSVHLVCRPRPENAPVGDWADVLRELPNRVGDWMERLQGEGVRGADLVFACIGPALEIFSRYRKVETADGSEVTLAEYLEKVWEVVGRLALEQVLGTAEAKARNGAAGAIEEDARLTALFLWTLQSTNGETSNGDSEAENEEDEGDAAPRGKTKGYSLVFDVARRFAQPLGIDLPKWEGRIIETKKGVVRLMAVSERAKQLFGEDGADAVADLIEHDSHSNYQQLLFPELEEDRVPKVRGRGRRRKAIMDTSDVELQKDREATTLDRVHAAMLLQSGGQANALRALIKAEQDRGPDFLRLANALSALYPKGSEEKRLLDAMLLAVPR